MSVEDSDDVEASFRGNSVSFSKVEIREHPIILGCSPSTSHGPPIEIGWQSISSMCFSLDEYEEIRPDRRVKNQMIMPAPVREAV
jgi:hypothetical protein